MKSADFPEATHRIGEGQEDTYNVLHAHVGPLPERPVTFCMDLTEEDVSTLITTRKLWVTQLTFGTYFQPIRFSLDKPTF